MVYWRLILSLTRCYHRRWERGCSAAPWSQRGISKSYVSRILRLALLAPDIIEAILEGRTDQALMLETLERPLPASWVEQRRLV